MPNNVLLPNGDLFVPYSYDDKGEIVQRPDNVDNSNLERKRMSGDTIDILMHELATLRAEKAAS